MPRPVRGRAVPAVPETRQADTFGRFDSVLCEVASALETARDFGLLSLRRADLCSDAHMKLCGLVTKLLFGPPEHAENAGNNRPILGRDTFSMLRRVRQFSREVKIAALLHPECVDAQERFGHLWVMKTLDGIDELCVAIVRFFIQHQRKMVQRRDAAPLLETMTNTIASLHQDREACVEVIEQLCDIVLGDSRQAWNDAYTYIDGIEAVRARICQLMANQARQISTR